MNKITREYFEFLKQELANRCDITDVDENTVSVVFPDGTEGTMQFVVVGTAEDGNEIGKVELTHGDSHATYSTTSGALDGMCYTCDECTASLEGEENFLESVSKIGNSDFSGAVKSLFNTVFH